MSGVVGAGTTTPVPENTPGGRVRAARVAAGLTQAAAGEYAELWRSCERPLSASVVSRFERGDLDALSVDDLFALCSALELDPAVVLFGATPRVLALAEARAAIEALSPALSTP